MFKLGTQTEPLTAHKLQSVGFGTHEHCCYIANGSALEEFGYPAGALARAVSHNNTVTANQRKNKILRNIVYYVASSLDGFISGLNDDISSFVAKGNGVEKYLADLAHFDTVIMGRNTYEFGYKYGLQPGQPAYPHMKHYIFSNNLQLENQHPQVHVKRLDIAEIDKLKAEKGTDIYLCGGGQFANWLLENQKIDSLKLKLNPMVLGKGIRLFGNSTSHYKLELVDSVLYDEGLQIMTFKILY